MNKTDQQLGNKVHEHLIKLGLETPMVAVSSGNLLNDHERKRQIAHHMGQIMGILHLDLSNDSLCETPDRVAKMFVNEIFSGLSYANFPKMTVIDNEMSTSEMVLERNITLNSTCEHHLLPIVGKAHVAYIPNRKVLGLSKMNRIVDFFARRPQVQERLVAQIHAAMCFLLETEDVAVIIEAEHMCVKTRGVEDACSDTVTSKISGRFLDPALRSEFIILATKV